MVGERGGHREWRCQVNRKLRVVASWRSAEFETARALGHRIDLLRGSEIRKANLPDYAAIASDDAQRFNRSCPHAANWVETQKAESSSRQWQSIRVNRRSEERRV